MLKGGMPPQAYAYPADMRAARDLLRRRLRLARQRAHLIAHIQNTVHQYNLPAPGARLGKGKALALRAKKPGQTVDAMLTKNRCLDEAKFMAHLQ